MRCCRVAGPGWADFACCVVTDRDDEVHFGCPGSRELIPTFRTKLFSGVAQHLGDLGGKRIDACAWSRSSRVANKYLAGIGRRQRLPNDLAGRVVGAEEKYVVGVQEVAPLVFFDIGRQGSPPQQFSSRKPLRACTRTAFGR